MSVCIPPTIRYQYLWQPVASFWLCAEHNSDVELKINGLTVTLSAGFCVWRIGAVSKLQVVSPVELDNIYISYGDEEPTQFI